MDRRFFKPLLTHSHPTLLDTLPTRCLPLGRILTSSEQLMHHPMMKKVETADTETLHLANSSQVIYIQLGDKNKIKKMQSQVLDKGRFFY